MSSIATATDVLAGTRRNAVTVGDCLDGLRSLPDGCVQTCVTSPPYYGLRDYGNAAQIGQEPTPREFVDALVAVFTEVRRVLADDGTLWLNIGDSYAATTKGSNGKGAKQRSNAGTLLADRRWRVPDGLKPKDLCGMPWRLAFALQDAGWWLRSDIIWSKPNPMPESVTDRPTRAHEYVFLLSKRERYFYDADAIREPHGSDYSRDAMRHAGGVAGGDRPDGNNFNKQTRHEDGAVTPRTRADRAALLNPNGRNARTVWSINTEPFSGAHFATMAPELARRCILAGSRRGDVVLDPFAGAGTTALVAVGNGRRAIGCELNPEYARIALDRVAAVDTDATEPVRVDAPQWGALFGRAK